jgi:hypothetical protein
MGVNSFSVARIMYGENRFRYLNAGIKTQNSHAASPRGNCILVIECNG